MSSISDPVITHRTIAERQRALMRWYRVHGRHHLPWRKTRDPYKVLVSEVMLQQTQVDRVIPYWITWMQRWPTMQSLARAKRADVIRAWAGLGYNRRAVYLHQLAQVVVRNPTLKSVFSISHEIEKRNRGRAAKKPHFLFAYLAKQAHGPDGLGGTTGFTEQLQRLPGVGPYTANALLAYAFGLDAPVVDTNVRRVLAYAIYRRPAITRMPLRRVMEFAARVIPRGQGRDWHFALMDYGALVLTARRVAKRPTPGVEQPRQQRKPERFEGSSRFWRGHIVAVFRDTPRPLSVSDLRPRLAAFGTPPSNLRALMGALIRDGIVTAVRHRYRLPTS